MTRVIDASVAAKWYLEEDGSPEARRLVQTGVARVAPELVLAELASVAWKNLRRGEITADQARDIAVFSCRHFDRLVPLEALAERAFEIAVEIDRPVYDAFYLACAESLEATLVTDDDRLLEAVRGTPWEERVEALRGRKPA